MQNSKDYIIVTGGDAHYYEMILELIQSIRRFPQGALAPIGIVDAGLTGHQRQNLESIGCIVVDTHWEYDLSPLRKRGRNFLKANIAKLMLPKYFPEFLKLLWIDGDAWVQSWNAIDLYLKAADAGKFAVVPQSGRHRANELMADWFWGGLVRVRSILYKNGHRAGLPGEILRKIALRATLNAGAFCLRADAPHWQSFQKWQSKIIKRGRIFTTDQLAMALAVYIDDLPVELLPDWCNYMGPWRVDAADMTLVEYYMPNSAVGIVHMAAMNEMRENLASRFDVPDLHDQKHRVNLRYGFWMNYQQDKKEKSSD